MLGVANAHAIGAGGNHAAQETGHEQADHHHHGGDQQVRNVIHDLIDRAGNLRDFQNAETGHQEHQHQIQNTIVPTIDGTVAVNVHVRHRFRQSAALGGALQTSAFAQHRNRAGNQLRNEIANHQHDDGGQHVGREIDNLRPSVFEAVLERQARVLRRSW